MTRLTQIIQRYKLQLLIGGCLLLFVVALFLSSRNTANNTKEEGQIPTKSYTAPIPGNTTHYQKTFEQSDASQKSRLQHDTLVAKLLHKLPYSQKEFSLTYDFQTNEFYLTLHDTTHGNTAFNAFLKQNGIQDRSWIQNLVVQ